MIFRSEDVVCKRRTEGHLTHTSYVTHLMVVEYGFPSCVARHVGHFFIERV